MEKVLIENVYGISFHIHEPEMTDDVITTLTASYSAYIDKRVKERLREETLHIGNSKPFIYLSNFGTRRAYRQKGYGRKMLQWVKEHFEGCFLWLEVSASIMGEMTDDELVDFYKSEGFKPLYAPFHSHQIMYIEL